MELKIDIEDTGGKGPVGQLVDIVAKIMDKLSVVGTADQLKAATTAAKRSLMSFDKLNRLTASSSKGSGNKNTISQFIAALKDDNALNNLKGPLATVAKLFRNLGVEMDYSNGHIFVLQKRLREIPLTMQQMISSTADFCARLIGMPTAAEQSERALGLVDKCILITAGLLEQLPFSAEKAASGLENSFSGTESFFQTRVAAPVEKVFGNLFSNLEPNARQAMSGTQQVFSDGAAAIADTFRSSWQQVLSIFSQTDNSLNGIASGVLESMKGIINRLIGGINNAIVEPFSGLNSAFSKLKSFTVNGTQPFKNLNFSISLPKIPLLASGAVLPANKPFMAVVGDQKHGTNVEAPLETIQQAVAQVMTENLEAEMAGHNATVAVLRQILEAVLGISLNENALGRAVQQYSVRQAMMTGGF